MTCSESRSDSAAPATDCKDLLSYTTTGARNTASLCRERNASLTLREPERAVDAEAHVPLRLVHRVFHDDVVAPVAEPEVGSDGRDVVEEVENDDGDRDGKPY